MCDCKSLSGNPVKLVSLYVSRSRTRMNSGGYERIGSICPICLKVKIGMHAREGIEA